MWIFAVNAGLPFTCISYNVMHDGFLDMMKMQEHNISLFKDFTTDKLIERFEFVTKNIETIRTHISVQRDHLRREIEGEMSHLKQKFPEIFDLKQR